MSTRPSPYRDSHGRTLEDYPRPSLAVDTAVLTVAADGRLCVLLTRTPRRRRGDTWRLPGTFVHPGETLARRRAALARGQGRRGRAEPPAAARLRRTRPRRPRLGGLRRPPRRGAGRPDPRARPEPRSSPSTSSRRSKYDHDEIVRSAVAALRSDYRRWPDPAGLLPDGPFTVRDLRLLHEQVLGERLVADTFRRTMLPHLRAVGESRRGARGKPAELFLRAESLIPSEQTAVSAASARGLGPVGRPRSARLTAAGDEVRGARSTQHLRRHPCVRDDRASEACSRRVARRSSASHFRHRTSAGLDAEQLEHLPTEPVRCREIYIELVDLEEWDTRLVEVVEQRAGRAPSHDRLQIGGVAPGFESPVTTTP